MNENRDKKTTNLSIRLQIWSIKMPLEFANQLLQWPSFPFRPVSTSSTTLMESELVLHSGGCHCKSVRWQVQAPTSVVSWQCNCSDCYMRGSIHFIVPSEQFEVMGNSKDFLTTYTFGTHTAKHTFCKVCGITSFYTPKSNPDGVAITYRCVDLGTLKHVEIRQFDGRNWDDSYAQTGIAACSKLPSD